MRFLARRAATKQLHGETITSEIRIPLFSWKEIY